MYQIDGKIELKSTNSKTGWFAGYASVYDCTDLHKDVVKKGAFDSYLKHTKLLPKMLWQHDVTQPIGRWEKIEENEKGLYVEGRLFLELKKSQEAFVLLKEGAVDALSIGFQVVKAKSSSTGERVLEEIHLHEISLVTFPANTSARVLNVKSKKDFSSLLLQLESLKSCINSLAK